MLTDREEAVLRRLGLIKTEGDRMVAMDLRDIYRLPREWGIVNLWLQRYRAEVLEKDGGVNL